MEFQLLNRDEVTFRGLSDVTHSECSNLIEVSLFSVGDKFTENCQIPLFSVGFPDIFIEVSLFVQMKCQGSWF